VVSAKSPSKTTTASLWSTIISFASIIALWVLSYYEYTISIRPSSQITLYLLYLVSSTAVQVRTLWLMQGMQVLAGLTTFALLLQLVLLVLECRSKLEVLAQKYGPYPPEAVKDVFNRSVFWWLNAIFRLGFSHDIQMDDMFPTEPALSSQILNSTFHCVWLSGTYIPFSIHATGLRLD